jgi:hypothetical protein
VEGGGEVTNKNEVILQVKGQDPVKSVAPQFSNFVGISRVAGEVQFEFIFLDLNQLATTLAGNKSFESSPELQFEGKTVAKLVIPAGSFYQLKDHISKMIADIEKEMQLVTEVKNARTGTNS